jgi:ribosome-binding protein aMBF1 (putative translation factor)
MTTQIQAPMSSLQLELLKIYALNPSEVDLRNVKQLLARYFADKLVAKIDEAIEAKGISEQDLAQWLDGE